MELFNEAGQFTGSKDLPQIFGAALNKTPIKAQAIKLAQKHVAAKLRVACDAGTITKWSVEIIGGLSLFVQIEFPPKITHATQGKHRFKIDTVQRIERTYSLEEEATRRSQLAMLKLLNDQSSRH